MAGRILAEVLIDCDGEDFISTEYARPEGYPDPFNTATTGLVLKKKYEWLRHALMRKGLYKLTKVTDRELMGFHSTAPSKYDYFYPFEIVQYDGAGTYDYVPGLITLTGNAYPVCGFKMVIDTKVPLLAFECVEQLESLPLLDHKGRYVNKIPIGRTEIKLLGVSNVCFMKDSNIVSKLTGEAVEGAIHVFFQMLEALPVTKSDIPCVLGQKVCKVDSCTGAKLTNKNFIPLVACLLDESRRMSFALGPAFSDILKQLKRPIGGDTLQEDGELTLKIKEYSNKATTREAYIPAAPPTANMSGVVLSKRQPVGGFESTLVRELPPRIIRRKSLASQVQLPIPRTSRSSNSSTSY